MNPIKSIAISGYKPYELGIFKANHPGIKVIRTVLHSKLIEQVETGVEWFISSAQTGVELWAMDIVQTLQADYPHVKTAILPPFFGWEERWSPQEQELFQSLLSQADYAKYITERPYESPTQLRIRNAFLVKHTDGLLLLYDEEQQGTPQYILKEARAKQAANTYEINWITIEDVSEAERMMQELEGDGRNDW
ncbi:DUF1273 domain-containing protein [Bacillaceae bacterium SIJ1]|uniref:DUF1273 domain-containing protein n=1 Tax=Litoribacterium kuwaitense TaxID=1398745 RepID=UPI0013EB52A6|nr:DUF1273 domain-containing protein [Litoribacterium kuwaitense]NGP43757.1 DUF1273 domain-containing protein [Litoribacterium kuwaitense]